VLHARMFYSGLCLAKNLAIFPLLVNAMNKSTLFSSAI
jgi:hypothetical protein